MAPEGAHCRFPVATPAYRYGVACGYCAVFKGRPRGRCVRDAGTVAGGGPRSLKTQQHAPDPSAELRIGRASGSVDMLGRTVGSWSWSSARVLQEEAGGAGQRRAVRAPVWCSLERR